MSRFAKMILIASMVLGIFAFVAADDADAGYGWGCYRGYSYSAPCYRPAYNYCNTYASPAIYRSSYGGFYPGYRSCYPSYNSCSFGGYGGFGGYGYGGYGGYGGYCVPTSYGQFNW